jgi:hypothetical protein
MSGPGFTAAVPDGRSETFLNMAEIMRTQHAPMVRIAFSSRLEIGRIALSSTARAGGYENDAIGWCAAHRRGLNVPGGVQYALRVSRYVKAAAIDETGAWRPTNTSGQGCCRLERRVSRRAAADLRAPVAERRTDYAMHRQQSGQNVRTMSGSLSGPAGSLIARAGDPS